MNHLNNFLGFRNHKDDELALNILNAIKNSDTLTVKSTSVKKRSCHIDGEDIEVDNDKKCAFYISNKRYDVSQKIAKRIWIYLDNLYQKRKMRRDELGSLFGKNRK